jgi:hypothetical protein
MKTIDIKQYGRPHPAQPSELHFVDAAHGKEVAEKTGLLEAVKAGHVNIVLVENTLVRSCRPSDSFIRGFVGKTAREVGVIEFLKRVTVNGEKLYLDIWSYDLAGKMCRYLTSEKKRLEREAKKKAREQAGNVWSELFSFFVPEIGTVVRLTKDWTFRLFYEHRTNDLRKQLGLKEYVWDWRRVKEPPPEEITIKAGAELSVNRIYIRQGANSFSSLTFYLSPKATIEQVATGKTAVTKGKCRFWAKLGDVNKMVVQIDKNTLAEN